MIKIKREGGHVQVEFGDNIAHLTYEQANKLGDYLKMVTKPYVVEITLEPDQYRDVSEDGTVKEQSKSTLNMPPMSGS